VAELCAGCEATLVPEAVFCHKCGRPVAVPGGTPSTRIEYRVVDLDWRRRLPAIVWLYDKGEPHPNAKLGARASAYRRVLDDLEPMLREGWELDGANDDAVDYEYEAKGFKPGLFTLFESPKLIFEGARVKLRRFP
jgi:hypothetical protein